MWQIAVAAAVAGSGLIAKHLFSPDSHSNTSITSQTEPNLEMDDEESQPSQISNKTHFMSSRSPINPPGQNSSGSSSFLNHIASEDTSRSTIHEEEEDGLFWFSSSGSGSRSGSRTNSRKSRKLEKKLRGSDKKVCSFDNGSVYQRKNCGKRVAVCLKRRKTINNSSRKRDSSLSKDCSTFGWGLGLGIIYMMSAGKAEISKLSSTIDETARVVHELQSELNKQKSVPSHQLLSSDGTTDTVNSMQKPVAEQVNMESCSLSEHPIATKILSHLPDSDYASSILTEEPQQEGTEMDQLEAELEFELRKLPWCTTEASEDVEKVSTQMERLEAVNPLLKSYQSDGVHPAELKSKLSSLLIEQQESHISELESELNLAYSKLQEKEAELRALKDCVKRLTECSLSTVSDEEAEVCREEQCRKLDHENFGVADTVMVGTKRTMHFRACGDR